MDSGSAFRKLAPAKAGGRNDEIDLFRPSLIDTLLLDEYTHREACAPENIGFQMLSVRMAGGERPSSNILWLCVDIFVVRDSLLSMLKRGLHMTKYGTFIWNELVTSDQKASGKFYSELLGWSRREVNAGAFGTYTIFQHAGKDVAGMMNPTIDYTRFRPPCWYAYIAVADVDACASRVTQLGGKIIEPPGDVPGVGRVCMIADPTGATLRLMTPIECP